MLIFSLVHPESCAEIFKPTMNCKEEFTIIVRAASSLDGDCQKWAIDDLSDFDISEIGNYMCLLGNYSFFNYTAPSFKGPPYLKRIQYV